MLVLLSLHGETLVLLWLGTPFVVAALLGAALARGWWSVLAIIAVGVSLAVGYFFLVYLNAPATRPDCSDCGLYWGRWWEPGFVALGSVVALCFWLLGIGVGAGLRKGIRAFTRAQAR